MTPTEFENLVTSGQLKREAFIPGEFDGLLRSGRSRLADARNSDLSLESRFDLAYNAAHALSLGALRWRGYRAENRYMVFQVLPLTTGVPNEVWRVLAKCHGLRNAAEYEGVAEIDARLLLALIDATERVDVAVVALSRMPRP
jgi:hypothetical protein